MFETEYNKILSELNGIIRDIGTSSAKKKEIKVGDLIVSKKQEVIMKKQFTPETEEKGTTTKIINLKGINSTNHYVILDLKKSSGIIRELTINCNAKFDIYIKSDETEVINNHGTFDDLSTLSGFSDSIVTSVSGSNYIINIRNISFKRNVNASIRFNGSITINNIFCVYDIGKAIPLFGYRDINLRGKFNEGTATIPTGATSVVVPHGLNGTPATISVTPLNEQGLNWFIPDAEITSINFTLYLQAAPFGIDANFKWSAKLSN